MKHAWEFTNYEKLIAKTERKCELTYISLKAYKNLEPALKTNKLF